MDWDPILDPPVTRVLAVMSLAPLPWRARRGLRLYRQGATSAGHPHQSRWVIRGIRDWILCSALLSFAIGLWFRSTPALVFGLVFVGEEIVETGVMLLALRCSRG